MQANPSKIKIVTQVIDRDRVAISIADNGGGIPESLITRVFDPFLTTKPVGKGTGLGLAISYHIVVEKHQGVLHCESQPGLGTQFWLELPVRQPQKTENYPLSGIPKPYPLLAWNS
jgi:signal transduction histidine kinase